RRLDLLEGAAVASHHETVADIEAPDAAARAGIEVAQALRFEPGATLDVVLEGRVAAVDHDVAFVEERHQRVDGFVGGRPVGQHEPDRPRRAQFAGYVFEALDGLGALGLELFGLGERAVPYDDPVTAAQQTPGHVAAHAPQTDHRQLHKVSPSSSWTLQSRGVWPGRSARSAVPPARLF